MFAGCSDHALILTVAAPAITTAAKRNHPQAGLSWTASQQADPAQMMLGRVAKSATAALDIFSFPV